VRYVLDTDTVAALMRGDEAVVSRLDQTPADEVGVPQPVWAELAYGIERLPSSRKRQWLTTRFELVPERLAPVPWTDAVSLAFGAIKARLERQGRRIEDFDVAIAAHALPLGATLVTSNLRHLSRVEGLRVEDWSAGP
jgi:tRNA(fMet)-specific endonuclease VapC